MNIAVIDFVFIGVVVIFVLRCALRGFVSEVMSLAAVAAGLLSAFFFFRAAGALIRERFMPGISTVPEVLAFVLLFMLAFALARILESILTGIINGFNLDRLDRFLGAVFGLVEGLAVVCIILFVISVQPLFDPDAVLGDSLFAELLLPFIAGRDWGLPGMIAGAYLLGGDIRV